MHSSNFILYSNSELPGSKILCVALVLLVQERTETFDYLKRTLNETAIRPAPSLLMRIEHSQQLIHSRAALVSV